MFIRLSRTRRRGIRLAFAAALACSLHAAAVIANDASEPVERMTASFERLTQIAFTAHVRMHATRLDDKETAQQLWLSAARDGDHWALLLKYTGNSWSAFQEVVTGERGSLQIQSADPELSQRRFPSAELVPLTGPLRVIGAFDGKTPLENIRPIDYIQFGQFLLGHLSRDYLPERLSGATLIAKPPREDLADCVVVTSAGPKETYTAWLDPKHGFLPRRVELRRNYGLPETNVAPSDKPSRNQSRQVPQIAERRRVIDEVKFATFNELPVIGEFNDTMTSVHADGQPVVIRIHFKVDEFHCPSPEDLAVKIPVPDGTRVHIMSEPAMRYEWRDGEIVSTMSGLDAEWMLKSAIAQARRENKRVLLHQTRLDSTPSRAMSRFLESQAAIIEQDFVVVNVDSTRDAHGFIVMSRLRLRTRGVPWLAILDEKGNVLATSNDYDGKNIGFPTDNAGVDHYLRMFSSTAQRMTPKQLRQVQQALQKQIDAAAK